VPQGVLGDLQAQPVDPLGQPLEGARGGVHPVVPRVGAALEAQLLPALEDRAADRGLLGLRGVCGADDLRAEVGPGELSGVKVHLEVLDACRRRGVLRAHRRVEAIHDKDVAELPHVEAAAALHLVLAPLQLVEAGAHLQQGQAEFRGGLGGVVDEPLRQGGLPGEPEYFLELGPGLRLHQELRGLLPHGPGGDGPVVRVDEALLVYGLRLDLGAPQNANAAGRQLLGHELLHALRHCVGLDEQERRIPRRLLHLDGAGPLEAGPHVQILEHVEDAPPPAVHHHLAIAEPGLERLLPEAAVQQGVPQGVLGDLQAQPVDPLGQPLEGARGGVHPVVPRVGAALEAQLLPALEDRAADRGLLGLRGVCGADDLRAEVGPGELSGVKVHLEVLDACRRRGVLRAHRRVEAIHDKDVAELPHVEAAAALHLVLAPLQLVEAGAHLQQGQAEFRGGLGGVVDEPLRQGGLPGEPEYFLELGPGLRLHQELRGLLPHGPGGDGPVVRVDEAVLVYGLRLDLAAPKNVDARGRQHLGREILHALRHRVGLDEQERRVLQSLGLRLGGRRLGLRCSGRRRGRRGVLGLLGGRCCGERPYRRGLGGLRRGDRRGDSGLAGLATHGYTVVCPAEERGMLAASATVCQNT